MLFSVVFELLCKNSVVCFFTVSSCLVCSVCQAVCLQVV